MPLNLGTLVAEIRVDDNGVDQKIRSTHRAMVSATKAADDLGKSVAGIWKNRGKDGGGDAAKTFAGEFIRGMRAATTAVAGSAGQLFSAGGPVALAILGAAVTLGLAVVGPALAAAVLAGAGVGLIGLGAFLLKDRPKIVRGFASLANEISTGMRAAAGPLEGPLVAAMGKLRQLARDIAPEFRAMFASLAPSIGPLVDGISGMVRSMMPGLREMMAAAGPALQDLARYLPELGAGFSDVFSSIAAAGPGAMQIFVELVTVILNATKAVFEFVEVVSKIADAAGPGLVTILGGVLPLIGAFTGAKDSARPAASAVTEFADSTRTASAEAEAAKNAVSSFRNELAGLHDPAIAAKEAQLDFLDSLHALRKGLQDNGRSFADNSEKGRENSRNLLEVAKAASEAAATHAELTGSQEAGLAKMNASSAAIRRMMLASGMAASEVDRLSGTILAVPERGDLDVGVSSHTRRSIAETTALDARIRLLKSKIVTAKANGARESSQAVQALRAQIAALQSKRVTIQVHRTLTGVSESTQRMADALTMKRRAAGGPIEGPGTGTSDSIPALLSNGEHVWTAREVQAAGGHAAMAAMRRAVAGRPAFAAGGAVGAGAGGGRGGMVVELSSRAEAKIAALADRPVTVHGTLQADNRQLAYAVMDGTRRIGWKG